MKVLMIAAVASNGAIGRNNELIYWLPNDMKRFRELTTGHTILMGRKTFESLPKGALPHRRNCVLSHTVSQLPGCECFDSWQAFADSCQADETVYIIGGASLYSNLLPQADALLLTEVADTPTDADTFFPDYSQWEEVSREPHESDARHAHPYAFVEYKLRKL